MKATEVLSFAREYVNDPSFRTPERQKLIKDAYRELTGEQLRTTCGTCLIEAIFKIRSIMEKQPCKYLLKPGAVLYAFGDTSKTATNSNLTDELAEWHLRHNPGVAKFFSKMPAAPGVPPEEVIILGGDGKISEKIVTDPAVEETITEKKTRKPRTKKTE